MVNEDIIISSRVRLARNATDLPFVSKMSDADAEKMISKVERVLTNSSGYRMIKMKDLSYDMRMLLVSKHLCSPELARSEKGALFVNEDETMSVMVNEEDHLRIQCILQGFNLDKADKLSSELDSKLNEKIDFCYDPKFGYLTACPTNLGTGMRASAMLHLAGLALAGQLDVLLSNITKLGYAVRGFYGEGSAAPGNIYQVSNQTTLGISEEEILLGLSNIASQIIDQEIKIRGALKEQNPTEVSDIVWRSYGICAYARKLSVKELMEHISNLKLGVSLGIINNLDQEQLNSLMTAGQNASLHIGEGIESDETKTDVARARLVRKTLKEVN